MQRVRIYVCSNIVIHGRTDFSNYVRTRDTQSSIASIKYGKINTKKKLFNNTKHARNNNYVRVCFCTKRPRTSVRQRRVSSDENPANPAKRTAMAF